MDHAKKEIELETWLRIKELLDANRGVWTAVEPWTRFVVQTFDGGLVMTARESEAFSVGPRIVVEEQLGSAVLAVVVADNATTNEQKRETREKTIELQLTHFRSLPTTCWVESIPQSVRIEWRTSYSHTDEIGTSVVYTLITFREAKQLHEASLAPQKYAVEISLQHNDALLQPGRIADDELIDTVLQKALDFCFLNLESDRPPFTLLALEQQNEKEKEKPKEIEEVTKATAPWARHFRFDPHSTLVARLGF
jgi:hypothetical protein